MSRLEFHNSRQSILLVNSLLVDLIKSHMGDLKASGISSAWLSDEDTNENSVMNGEF